MVSNTNLHKSQNSHLTSNSAIINIDKDPVELLYEIFGIVRNNISVIGFGAHNKCVFKIVLIVNGQRYTAEGPTLKLAKKSASLAALAELCNVYYDPKKMQPYVHVPVPSIEKLSKQDVLLVSSTKEVEPEKILTSLLATKEELIAKEVKPNKGNAIELPKPLEIVDLTVNDAKDNTALVKLVNGTKSVGKFTTKNKKFSVYREPLTIEEIFDDVPTSNNVQAKTIQPLKNISNLPAVENKLAKKSTKDKPSTSNTITVSKKSNLKNNSPNSNLNNTPVIWKQIKIINKKQKRSRALSSPNYNLPPMANCNDAFYGPPISNCNGQVPLYNISNMLPLIGIMNALASDNCVRSYARNPINFGEPIVAPTPYVAQPVNLDAFLPQQQQFIQNQSTTAKPNRKRTYQQMSNPPVQAAKKRPNSDNSVCQLPKKKRCLLQNWSTKQRNPLMVLHEICPGLEYNLEAEMGTNHAPFFMMSAIINDRKYFGHGKSKLLARRDAAVQILRDLKDTTTVPSITANNMNMICQKNGNNNVNLKFPNNFSSLQMPEYQANIIESKILQTFFELTNARDEFKEYKVLAGIVMTIDFNFQQAQVVSLATGTKCINGGNICFNGSVLNDSHAEVIARRGLMKFLYGQVNWHCNPEQPEKSIFTKNQNGNKFSLKSNVHFHLYISSAPCGDARTFSGNDRVTNTSPAPSNACGQYGLLRTKVEGGLGTIPVGNSYHQQTWDGVMFGEPLHTMSCSDKIARWNVLGIQGSILSNLIEPIYLHSIVLGSMLHPQHMYRAVCGRIEKALNILPKPYHLHRPLLGQTSKKNLPRTTNRIPSFGINWSMGDNDIEVISQQTGRQIYDGISFLTKQKFFQKYVFLLQNLPNIGEHSIINNYGDLKESAKDYQTAKNVLFAAFQHAELGCWVKKPVEQNEFSLNNIN